MGSRRLLLEHGADIEAKRFDGRTPLLVASERGHVLGRGAPRREGGGPRSRGAIHIAAYEGHGPMVPYLFDQGASTKRKNGGKE